MTPTRRSQRPAPPARGNSSSLVAILALLVIVGAVFIIFLMMDKGKQPTGGTEVTPTVDPFADVPDEEPPMRKPRRGDEGTTDDPFAGVSDPFAEIENPREDPIWLGSLSAANRAIDKITEAAVALENGDRSTAITLRVEAKELLEDALDATRDWAIQLEAQYGSDDRFVRLVNKRTKKWREHLMGVRKSGGM